jgi:hypothetical protein
MNNLTSYKTIVIIGLVFLFIAVSCKTGKKSVLIAKENNRETFIIPPLIIYKTRKDYFYNLPVDLSDDKMSVISYPDIVDIYHEGKIATPTILANGYLLDNRGIGPNSVFTKYSYEEYSKLEHTPTAKMLFNQIIDFDPITEMYSCKCSRDTLEINRKIREGLNDYCKKIK